MDLRDIEYFAVIAEHGHMGQAAEALGLGQPALSMSLRRLERSAEAMLVRRTPKGVELTSVGSALLSHVRRLRLARDDLAREVGDLAHGRAGHLRIGAAPAPAETLLPPACSELLMTAPKITLSVTSLDNDSLLPALRRGDLDLVVAHVPRHPQADLAQDLIGEDRFVVYCSAHHQLAKRKSVLLRDLIKERWACTPASARTSWLSLQRSFEEQGLPPPHLALISDAVALRHRVVASSNLIGIATKRAVQAVAGQLDLTLLRVRDLNWVRPVAVVYRKEAYLSPAAQRFIEVIKDTAKNINVDQK